VTGRLAARRCRQHRREQPFDQGAASLAPTQLLPQRVKQTAAIDVDLPDGRLHLRYRRRLRLSAPLGGEATFQVVVDGEVVDKASFRDHRRSHASREITMPTWWATATEAQRARFWQRGRKGNYRRFSIVPWRRRSLRPIRIPHSTCRSNATSSLWRWVSVLAKTDFS